LYWRERIDDVTHAVSKQLGFHTGTGSQGRKVMLDNLLVEVNNLDGVWTNDFLQECLVFIRNDQGRPEAAEGKHDDEVISTGICHYVRQNAPAEFKDPSNAQPKSVEQKIMERLERKKINKSGISQSNYY
jgi:phage terminase large subunit